MTVRATALLLVLFAGTAFAKNDEFSIRTMKPARRSALPRLRVPVGPDRPLAIAGRARKVTFAVVEDELRADLDGKPGCEVAVVAAEAVEIPLDADEEVRRFVFVRGNPEADEPAWSVVALDVLVGRIGPERVFFVDHDADGTYFTPDTDYLVREKSGEPHPVTSTVILGRKVYTVTYDEAARRVEATEDREFASRDVFTDWAGSAAGLAHLNRIRGEMNILPVTLDRKAARDTLAHIRYLARNGGNGHMEEEGKPGYTRAGLNAGLNSIGSLNLGGVPSTIDGHLGSLLHRMELIDPRITRVGIASDSSRVWIHTECGKRREWNGQGPHVFPGPARSWHVGYYSGENPDPRPKEGRGTSGLPVTVAFYDTENPVRKVAAELRGPRGKIRCWKNDSTSRDLKTNHSGLRAVLMPRTTLGSGRHRLTLTWETDTGPRRLVYEFRIGRR